MLGCLGRGPEPDTPPAPSQSRPLSPAPIFSDPKGTITPASETAALERSRPGAGGQVEPIQDPLDRALAEADQAYAEDDLARARIAYRRALQLAPQDPRGELGLLRIALLATQVPIEYASAPGHPKLLDLLKELDRLAAKHQGSAAIELERGRVLLILGRPNDALSALKHAVQLTPKDAEAQSALGVAFLATGQASQAVAPLRLAALLDPTSADRRRNLGTAELMVGETAQAIASYRKAVELSPRDARARSDLGTALLAQGLADLAVLELDQAVALDPDRATFRSNLSYAAILLGRLEQAEREARAALRLDEKLGSAWINLGTVHARRQAYDEAERAYRRALTLDPTDPRAKASLEELSALRRDGRRP